MVNQDTLTGPSFSLSNRLARVSWNITYMIFFKYTPHPFFKWRSLLLKLFGAKVGKGVHIYPKAKIWAPWNLEIGTQSSIANGANVYCQGRITIGDRTIISQGVHLVSGTHDYTDYGFPLITKPIHIGDLVWIASDVFIHPGVVIGNGCVIGARSVVNKNLPSWMVCSGHPCIPIKERKLFKNIPKEALFY
ncbi:LbetaH domain-containing protein [Anditalea andensis]|uniref:Acetyltransferase n=1 Tax=Anditalea andensis TaxID=1048983 RepID=A0A074KVK9_9BACT|nr:acetyltransferase [Anditalea andensis]KEO72290.1 acetyltransferase [Anditalea andensis]